MTKNNPFIFRVVDLKQYAYCARVLYFQTVLPQIRPLTYKMAAGIAAHHAAESREKRRQLRTYGLQDGTRTFNVPVYSEDVGLSGEIDMLIEAESELIPVDYKLSRKEGKHFRLQVMAYGRLLAATRPTQKPVNRGFLYLIPQRRAVEVRFTAPLQRQFDKSLAELRQIAQMQQMPPVPKQRGCCVDCEFRRFCNDVI
ncbi:MAG: CRISPR-associated protein Cas4 [Chloroflexi bacterium]|nr:CRISPR-associated protein Cas4 [Chloroflexota bacterium]